MDERDYIATTPRAAGIRIPAAPWQLVTFAPMRPRQHGATRAEIRTARRALDRKDGRS